MKLDFKQWQCRQAALAVCKYYFSACSFDANSNKMADMVLGAVNDKIDEVVSSAISALAIFLDNARIESDSKQKLMKHSIDAVWGVLQDRARFEQVHKTLAKSTYLGNCSSICSKQWLGIGYYGY